jgi:hypothetical protein
MHVETTARTRKQVLVAAVVVAAVSCSPSPLPILSSTGSAAMDDPRAYMLGRGVPRDYRKAAALYASRCREGCGDLAACEAYLELGLRQRGIPTNQATFTVAARLCDRKVSEACWIALLAGIRGEEALEQVPMGSELEALCDGGDVRACRAELDTDLGMSGSGSHQSRMHRLAEKVCLEGNHLPACIESMKSMFLSCDADRGQPCVDERVAWHTENQLDSAPTKQIWARVQAACAEGDADACSVVPGKEIDARLRCEAGDYVECNRLAQDGDVKAAALACAGGLTERCVPPVPSGTYGVPPFVREQCEQGQKDMCEVIAKVSPPRCP